MSSFQELPAELQEKILLDLDLRDLVTCQCVSSTLNKIIRASLEISYQMMLERSGNLDNPRSSQTISKKRNNLEMSNSYWSSWPFIPPASLGGDPRLKHFRTTKLLGFTESFFIYGARSIDKDDNLSRYLIYTHYPSDIDSYIKVVNARTVPRNWIVPPPSWIEEAGIVRVVGLGTDNIENRITAVIYGCAEEDDPNNFSIYVAISDNDAAPPGAGRRAGYLSTVCLENPIISATANVQISGENIAFILYSQFMEGGEVCSSYGLTVLDAKSGLPKTGDDLIFVEGPELAFLSTDHLLVPNIIDGSIDVYHIPTTASREAITDESLKPTITLVASYMLPDVVTEYNKCVNIDIQCSPNPFGGDLSTPRTSIPVTKPVNGFPEYSEPPYVADPHKAIIAITMSIANKSWSINGPEELDLASPRFLIHRCSLLHAFEAALKSKVGSHFEADVPKIPWETWGPDNCRWFSVPKADLVSEGPGSLVRKFCVYGQRYVAILPRAVPRSTRPFEAWSKVDDNSFVRLYDFNPSTLKRLRQNERAIKETGVESGTEKDTTQNQQMPYKVVDFQDPHSPHNKLEPHRGRVFRQDTEGGVVGRLGYVEYTMPGLSGVEDVMIDANKVIQQEPQDPPFTKLLGLFFVKSP